MTFRLVFKITRWKFIQLTREKKENFQMVEISRKISALCGWLYVNLYQLPVQLLQFIVGLETMSGVKWSLLVIMYQPSLASVMTSLARPKLSAVHLLFDRLPNHDFSRIKRKLFCPFVRELSTFYSFVNRGL